jgi:RNA polymerase sigma-70 factor (ECF subfamily)
MANTSEYLTRLTADYLPVFFAFAVKNMNNLHEAEEFSQEAAYQCVLAIHRVDRISNFNAFVWSVTHNTYKRWCARKRYVPLDNDMFSNLVLCSTPLETDVLGEENKERIRLGLSRLTDLYRKTLVCFYYDEMSITETSAKLGISVEMVKFYLQKGRQKLKEVYSMIGEKSFNPSEFSVYKASIDFSSVNVWEVFKRKLPCQIALICHDGDRTVNEISSETGVPAVYIEEEIGLLKDAGVMINPVRGKYRTNFFILRKNVIKQMKEQFDNLYAAYLPSVVSAYETNLPQLKTKGIFKHDVPDNRYAWFFVDKVTNFDYSETFLSDDDYPQILSCGSRGFIFAAEAKETPWSGGATPTTLEKCTVWPVDMVIFGDWRFQRELRDERKAQALYDVYTGSTNDNDIEIYTQLIKEGYIVKKDGSLFCNVAVSTPLSREFFNQINTELTKELKPLCKTIRENIGRIVQSTIPPQLKKYARGYTEIWIQSLAHVCFCESLHNRGFITLPEKGDKTPVACYIYEN